MDSKLTSQVSDAAPRFPIPKSQSQGSNESQSKLKTQITVNTASSVENLPNPTGFEAASPKQTMMDYATPEVMVSTFCRAVFLRIIPKEFWGTGDVQNHNEKTFIKNVDRFIALRRFESLSLHEVSQGLQVAYSSAIICDLL